MQNGERGNGILSWADDLKTFLYRIRIIKILFVSLRPDF